MIAAFLIGISTVFFKKALMERELFNSWRSGWFWLGALAGISSALAFTKELEESAVSRSVPLLAQSYLVVLPLSALWLGEKVGRREMLGIALILLGSVMI